MNERAKIIIIFVLGLGLIYKVLVTSHGNFIFNMDNARDMVDVREMVELKKPRLIGQTSGIAGLYNGPGWYYLLSIPYIFTNGDPYAEVLLMILLWVIGGYFVLKIASGWGLLETLIVGIIWLSSNYINLATVYAFNPNPVTLLMPVFVYFFKRYLDKPSFSINILIWILAGLFFNFEMAFGVFVPIIIILVCLIYQGYKYFLTKFFWLGTAIFFIALLPQIIFELKHNFLMTHSIINLITNKGMRVNNLSLGQKFNSVIATYISVFNATWMNWQIFSTLFLATTIVVISRLVQTNKLLQNKFLIVCLGLVIIPFLGYIFLPITVMSWHLGGSMAALIIMLGFLINYLRKTHKLSSWLTGLLAFIIIAFSIVNLKILDNLLNPQPSADPLMYKNEIAAIDYIYQQSHGQDFKVYTYLPSVYDYPYQYLIWWYGRKKYGYLPLEYTYLPNRPQYIPSQTFFSARKSTDANLIFLIKELDRPDLVRLWENNFNQLPVKKVDKVGPLEIETRTVKLLK